MEATDESGADDSHLKSSAPGNDTAPFLPHTSFVQVSAKGEPQTHDNMFCFVAVMKETATHTLLSYRKMWIFITHLFFFFVVFLLLSPHVIFPDNAIHTSGINSISNLFSESIQHSTAVTVTPVSPMPTSLTSLQPSSEDQQSFVSLTPPLAFSLNGEEYVLNLGEDEGITDLFSSVDLDHLPLDMPILWTAILEI